MHGIYYVHNQLIYLVICTGSLSVWYANPPFRVNHFAKRTMELELEDESSKGGPELVPVDVTYLPKGKYLIEVFFCLFLSS